MPVFITHQVSIDESEFSLTATRSQGAGGQHVNKVATAIYLRFDINQSSLPEKIKTKLNFKLHTLSKSKLKNNTKMS